MVKELSCNRANIEKKENIFLCNFVETPTSSYYSTKAKFFFPSKGSMVLATLLRLKYQRKKQLHNCTVRTTWCEITLLPASLYKHLEQIVLLIFCLRETRRIKFDFVNKLISKRELHLLALIVHWRKLCCKYQRIKQQTYFSLLCFGTTYICTL